MQTIQSQIKLNLPLPLKEYLESKASKFGMPLAGYIKHLILQDVSDMDYLTYHASQLTEEAYHKAKQQEQKGKLINITDIDSFFNDL